MTMRRHGARITIGIDWGFGPEELENRIFGEQYSGREKNAQVWRFFQTFSAFMEREGIRVVTVDQADFESEDVPYAIYFDYSWRRLLKERFLFQIPRKKRVLLILEPSNINPSLHFIPLMRRLFSKVFTFNDEQAERFGYTKINYFVLSNMIQYRTPPFSLTPFLQRKMLIAINSNRGSYMPTSTYPLRIEYFRFFDQRYPYDFHLFGHGWNKPRTCYDKWFGFPRFACYQGEIAEDITSKIEIMSRYKFLLCIENNINEPGYVSEKITDCFCARCVPLYLGWKHADRYIPADCFINLRDFDSIESAGKFIESMDAAQYQHYLDAIEGFVHSKKAEYFTNENVCRTIIQTLFPSDSSPQPCVPDGSNKGGN